MRCCSCQVLQCQADGREAGSLFSILDHTQTAFGRRVLAGWVRQPLLSPEDITARQVLVVEKAWMGDTTLKRFPFAVSLRGPFCRTPDLM